jgi:hypothetical protein
MGAKFLEVVCDENGIGGDGEYCGDKDSQHMIAVAGDGTNAMDVSKNVRAWRCTRCPARLQVCCPC